ncbi:MAG: hemerythrin domain-containing protein [Gammaproteobacteria bacterium]|nr:hemerythrin domain-containing protein [Gammaproteobacteria bacterium]
MDKFKMKIPKQLIALTKEHHLSLSLANKAINAKKLGNEVAICQQIAENFEQDFLSHFNFEEQYILPLLTQNNQPDCQRIISEHRQLLRLAKDINTDNLLKFGELLKTHTRFEDRVLFKQIPADSLHRIPT